MNRAISDIRTERQRQLDLTYSRPHDDTHTNGELTMAAISRAGCTVPAVQALGFGRLYCGQETAWPYAVPPMPRSPGERRAKLVQAAALLVAEIERMDRAQGLPEAEQDAEVWWTKQDEIWGESLHEVARFYQPGDVFEVMGGRETTRLFAARLTSGPVGPLDVVTGATADEVECKLAAARFDAALASAESQA